MKYIINASEAKTIDDITINKTGIPSMVLMERAALAVAVAADKHIKKIYGKKRPDKPVKILSVCGNGNNGADAAAAARILYEMGYDVDIFTLKKSGTCEFNDQLSIARASGVKIINRVKFAEYNIIIDGVFGIGLSRDVEGQYAQVIDDMNGSNAWILSVDIPSGINASDGKVMGTAVKADKTVTFGCTKLGCVLYPGTEYTGRVITADVGFASKAVDSIKNKAFTYTADDLKMIPGRRAYSNKGDYGKIFITAGSADMGGAAVLASLSAYRSGAGIVEVFTHEAQRSAVQKNIPEAIVRAYGDDTPNEELVYMLKKALSRATCVITGPGLSTSETAACITEYMIRNTMAVTVLDADALNLIAADNRLKRLLKSLKRQRDPGSKRKFIVTPHLGEMSRLTGKSVADIKQDLIGTARDFAGEYGVICVMKDARTITASPDGRIYINTSGNSGMATGGSGDVLTGIIAGMTAIGLDAFEAACMGVFLHGLGGDRAAKERGKHGIKAGDIIDGVTKIMSGI